MWKFGLEVEQVNIYRQIMFLFYPFSCEITFLVVDYFRPHGVCMTEALYIVCRHTVQKMTGCWASQARLVLQRETFLFM